MDCSPPGSSVHGIIQARVLEWVAIYFSLMSEYLSDTGRENGKWKVLFSASPGYWSICDSSPGIKTINLTITERQR